MLLGDLIHKDGGAPIYSGVVMPKIMEGRKAMSRTMNYLGGNDKIDPAPSLTV